MSSRVSMRQALSRRSTAPAPDALAERLAADFARRWRQGERPTTEEYLARHPDLADHPPAAVQILCEELCLREETGDTIDNDAVLARFPQWREQLLVVLQCRELFQPERPPPAFPKVGERCGEFQLLAELGRGLQGRVYLATQPALADRPVVLKLTPCDGQEHLMLARLQHTNIVPLYSARDDADRNLRFLCMPYFGGTSLDALLKRLPSKPLAQRTGTDLLAALDAAEAGRALAAPRRGVGRKFLAQASYVQAICWLGAGLADAVQFAHERGLVHLDLKPGNVLLAADGQPMLLDFHLSRAPLGPQDPEPDWLGGTVDYMSPEHRAAIDAVTAGRKLVEAVGAPADIYALGLVLYEALGGTAPPPADAAAELRRRNPAVSVGLADLLAKCLAAHAQDRYGSMAALAADLRNHLNDRLLVGVPNRSWAERRRKWRVQHPGALRRLTWSLVVLLALAAVAGVLGQRWHERHQGAVQALADGRQQLDRHDPASATQTLLRGRTLAAGLPLSDELLAAFSTELERAHRLQLTAELHRLADQARFHAGAEQLTPAARAALTEACRSVWDARTDILAGPVSPEVRTDLLDLAILYADLRVRTAPAGQEDDQRRAALAMLGEAETLLGKNAALCRERETQAKMLGLSDLARQAANDAAALPPRTAWEHEALGRTLLRAGRLPEAAAAFDEAVRLQPQSFWANFHQGICAYRAGTPGDAVTSFRVCIALAPDKAECYFNRALAYQALGDAAAALRDYDRALELHPALASASLNRAVLHLNAQRWPQALADLEIALRAGADPAAVHYNLALVHLGQHDKARALASVQQALRHQPHHKAAADLRDRLQRER